MMGAFLNRKPKHIHATGMNAVVRLGQDESHTHAPWMVVFGLVVVVIVPPCWIAGQSSISTTTHIRFWTDLDAIFVHHKHTQPNTNTRGSQIAACKWHHKNWLRYGNLLHLSDVGRILAYARLLIHFWAYWEYSFGCDSRFDLIFNQDAVWPDAHTSERE